MGNFFISQLGDSYEHHNYELKLNDNIPIMGFLFPNIHTFTTDKLGIFRV